GHGLGAEVVYFIFSGGGAFNKVQHQRSRVGVFGDLTAPALVEDYDYAVGRVVKHHHAVGVADSLSAEQALKERVKVNFPHATERELQPVRSGKAGNAVVRRSAQLAGGALEAEQYALAPVLDFALR